MDSPPRYSVRKRVLQDATAAVLKSRNADYGPPDQDFRRTAEMVTAMWAHKLNDPLTTANVAQFIACVKLSRMQHSPTLDNWVDLAGYAACGAECEAIEHGLLATWGLVEEEAKAKYPEEEPEPLATHDEEARFYLQRHQDDTATIVIQAQEIADLKRSVMVERRDHQESIVTYNRERDDLVRAHTALAKAPQVLPIL